MFLLCLHIYVDGQVFAGVKLISGNLQNGRFGNEDARGREHAGEADRQDIPADGPEQGR